MIGDRVWLDVDGDGVQDVGEVGLSNVTVQLFRDPNGVPGSGDEVLVGTAFTDGNGNYLFDRVYPGTGTFYAQVLSTTLPPGLIASPGNNNGRGPSLTITGNDVYLANDFGYTSPAGTAVVGDRIWSDADGDAVQDPGEVGIGGVTVRLMAPGPDGLFGTVDDVVTASTTTAADGTYLFVGVAPGIYRVDVTDTGGVLTGYTLTLGPEPSNPILVAAGDVDVSRDFGYRNASLFSIANAVWDDEDGDGIRDAGEAGIANVTVAIRSSGGLLLGTAVTDANGNFQFSGLGNGNYTLDLTDTGGLLTNLQATTAAANAGQLAVTVAGANVSAVSFGYRSLGTIGEVVWSDSDGDGIRDPSEPGIGGVTVRIIISGPDGLFGTLDDAVIATTTTATDGSYRFSGLPQAYYRVQVTDTGNVLAAFTQTGDPDVVIDEQGNVPLLAGAVDLSMNFGYQNASLADVSGTTFDDTDTDGVQDVGESGLAGVSLDLVAPGPDGFFGTIDDLIVATTFTDGSGNYGFVDVPNGSYRVRVTDTGNVLNGYTITSGLDQIPVTVAGVERLEHRLRLRESARDRHHRNPGLARCEPRRRREPVRRRHWKRHGQASHARTRRNHRQRRRRPGGHRHDRHQWLLHVQRARRRKLLRGRRPGDAPAGSRADGGNDGPHRGHPARGRPGLHGRELRLRLGYGKPDRRRRVLRCER